MLQLLWETRKLKKAARTQEQSAIFRVCLVPTRVTKSNEKFDTEKFVLWEGGGRVVNVFYTSNCFVQNDTSNSSNSSSYFLYVSLVLEDQGTDVILN